MAGMTPALLPAATACAVLVLIAVLSRKLFDSNVSPPAFFSGVWAVPLAVLALWGHEYFFSWRAAVVVCGVHLAFFGASLIPLLIAGAPARPDPPQRNLAEPAATDPGTEPGARSGRVGLLLGLTAVLGSLGVLGSLLLLFFIAGRYGSVIAMFSLADLVREDLTSTGIALPRIVRALVLCNHPAAVLGGALLAINPERRAVALLPIAGVIIGDFSGFGRAGFVLASSLYVSSYLLGRQVSGRPVTGRQLAGTAAVVAAAGITFFTAIQLARFQGRIPLRELAETLRAYYLSYLSGSLPGFSAYLDFPGTALEWGRAGFTSVLESLQVLGLPVDTTFDHYYWPTLVGSGGVTINLFTFLRPIREDFGPAGLAMFFFLLGFAGSSLFVFGVRRGNRPSAFLLAGVYSYLVYGLITSAALYASWLAALVLPAALYVSAKILLPTDEPGEDAA